MIGLIASSSYFTCRSVLFAWSGSLFLETAETCTHKLLLLAMACCQKVKISVRAEECLQRPLQRVTLLLTTSQEAFPFLKFNGCIHSYGIIMPGPDAEVCCSIMQSGTFSFRITLWGFLPFYMMPEIRWRQWICNSPRVIICLRYNMFRIHKWTSKLRSISRRRVQLLCVCCG